MTRRVANRLGGWRRAKGLTQAALARLAHVPQSALSEVENGRRDLSLRTLFKLAVALEMTPGTLLDKDPPWLPLTRRQLDAVSRAAVTGRRNLPPAHRLLADACAAAMRPTIEAHAAAGAARSRMRGARSIRAAEQRFGQETVRAILERIDRHAGSEAL